MKNLSIFEPQIEKHYAYKKKNMYCTLIEPDGFSEKNLISDYRRSVSEKL